MDLGAGTGVQTVALAKLGFRVVATDFSAALLAELRVRTEDLLVEAYEDNLLNFRQRLRDDAPELIVCMGDTLTHLGSMTEIAALFAECYRASLPSGRLAVVSPLDEGAA